MGTEDPQKNMHQDLPRQVTAAYDPVTYAEGHNSIATVLACLRACLDRNGVDLQHN